jgi:hypothetical protein
MDESHTTKCTIRETNAGLVDGNDEFYHETNGADKHQLLTVPMVAITNIMYTVLIMGSRWVLL